MKIDKPLNKYRGIFPLTEVNCERVAYVAYIPESKEIFVQLFREDIPNRLECQGYFFQSCDQNIYDGMMSNKETIWNFVQDILYKTKDYTLETIWNS